jgi:hypothetical protein
MRPIIPAALAAAALVTLSLSACDSKVEVKANLTIPAKKLADQAAAAITKQVGQEATADCGDKPINLVNGNVIHCKLGPVSDPNTVYDATVTLSDVHGSKFHLDVKNSQETIAPDATLPAQSK